MSHFRWSLSWMNSVAEEGKSDAVLLRATSNRAVDPTEEGTARTASLRAQITSLFRPTEILHFVDDQTIIALMPQSGNDRTNEISKSLTAIGQASLEEGTRIDLEAVQLPLPAIGSDAGQWLASFLERPFE
ncbi:MAG: hypothetical protein ACU0AZ_17415 [Paracoccaceae bacterium]